MKKVFIDPGHGGSESGACANGIVEKDINLKVALKLKELLLSKGFDVLMSRTTDTYVGLVERCNMANNWGADIFISIHHNAGGGDGYEVIHTIHTRVSQGDELAKLIGQAFSEIGQNCRRIYARESTNYPNQDYYTVIQKPNMPAIITEYAFLDTADCKAVDTVQELHNEAVAIFKGICRFYNVPLDMPKVDPVTSAINNIYINTKDIINSPDYWLQNAVVGGVCKGEYVSKLIVNFNNYINKKG